MASYYTIPLQPYPQTQTITLSGVVYTLTFNYRNTSMGGWVMDIGDSQNTAIVQGIPLVTGANLLAQYSYLGFTGAMWVQTANNPDAVPTFQNLGSEGLLYYVTA